MKGGVKKLRTLRALSKNYLAGIWSYLGADKVFSHHEVAQFFPHGEAAVFIDQAVLIDGVAYALWRYLPKCKAQKQHFDPAKGRSRNCPGYAIYEFANLTAACISLLSSSQRVLVVKGVDFRVSTPLKYKEFLAPDGGFIPGITFLAVAKAINERRGRLEAEVRVYIASDYLSERPEQVAIATVVGGVVG